MYQKGIYEVIPFYNNIPYDATQFYDSILISDAIPFHEEKAFTEANNQVYKFLRF